MLKRLITPYPYIMLCVLGFFTAIFISPQDAHAQSKLIFIRDAESEAIIRTLATPLFKAAQLNPTEVSLRLIQDKSLNAFVSGGRNIYIHTGLLMQSQGLDSLLGVLAHETGHIEGGHLNLGRTAVENAATIQMIGAILGTIAAVGSGRSDVGTAIFQGSQAAGQRSFFKFSRTQESAADQAAMRLMDATGRSARGLEAFLSVLEDQEVLSTRQQDPYIRSHPLSRDRLNALRHHIEISPFSDVPTPTSDQLMFERMVAKLVGFIEPLAKVLRRYPDTDQSFAARYARTIAYYRQPDLKRALSMVDDLMKDAPDDPYLFELKGQMLFEHGRAEEALSAYQQAFRLAPKEPLLALELARVELELNDPATLDDAILHFRMAINLGNSSVFVWQQLGIAHGRKGEMGESALARAEAEFRQGKYSDAEYQANRAIARLTKGTRAYLQAEDILNAVKTARESRSGNR